MANSENAKDTYECLNIDGQEWIYILDSSTEECHLLEESYYSLSDQHSENDSDSSVQEVDRDLPNDSMPGLLWNEKATIFSSKYSVMRLDSSNISNQIPSKKDLSKYGYCVMELIACDFIDPIQSQQLQRTMALLSKYCENIKTTKLTECCINHEAEKHLLNLKSLKLISCKVTPGTTVLSDCQQLIKLKVSNIEGFNSKILRSSFPHLETLTLNRILLRDDQILTSFFKSHTNLKKLNVDDYFLAYPTIAEHLEQLETLCVTHLAVFTYCSKVFLQNLEYFSKLKGLRKLKVRSKCCLKAVSSVLNEMASVESIEFLLLEDILVDEELIDVLPRYVKLGKLHLIYSEDFLTNEDDESKFVEMLRKLKNLLLVVLTVKNCSYSYNQIKERRGLVFHLKMTLTLKEPKNNNATLSD